VTKAKPLGAPKKVAVFPLSNISHLIDFIDVKNRDLTVLLSALFWMFAA